MRTCVDCHQGVPDDQAISERVVRGDGIWRCRTCAMDRIADMAYLDQQREPVADLIVRLAREADSRLTFKSLKTRDEPKTRFDRDEVV